MLEIVEDRYANGSLIITSQVPIDRWHDLIGVPTLADAILDRVVHNAYRIELAGESLRKPRSNPKKRCARGPAGPSLRAARPGGVSRLELWPRRALRLIRAFAPVKKRAFREIDEIQLRVPTLP